MSLWVIVIMGLIAGNTGKAAATGVEGVLVGAMVNKFTKYPPKCIFYKAFSIGSNSDKLIGTHIYIDKNSTKRQAPSSKPNILQIIFYPQFIHITFTGAFAFLEFFLLLRTNPVIRLYK